MSRRDQLTTLLKRSSHIPLKEVVAIHSQYWNVLLINLHEILNIPHETLPFDKRVRVKYMMHLKLKDIMLELNPASMDYLLDLLEKIVVFPPENYDKNDYHTIDDLSDILLRSKEEVTLLLEKGIIKSAFIDRKGRWLKHKLN